MHFQLDESVTLAPLQAHQAGELFELTLENKAHLRAWLPWLDFVSKPEDSLDFIQDTERGALEGSSLHLGIFQQGRLQGLVSFNKVDKANRIASIGYWLSQSALGQGLVTRAAGLLIRHGFTQIGLNRIELRCATGNEGSNSVALRLGMSLEGTLRQQEWLYDHFVDHNVYAMHRDEMNKLPD